MFVSGEAGLYSGSLNNMHDMPEVSGKRIEKRRHQSVRVVSFAPPGPGGVSDFCALDLGQCRRVAMMLTPTGRGNFSEQLAEILSRMQEAVEAQGIPMRVATQTVFLRDPEDQVQCQRLIDAHFGSQPPLTTFAYQPPCNGFALAIEAWAMGGPGLQMESFGRQALAVTYDDLRWVFCGGIMEGRHEEGVYPQTSAVLRQMRDALGQANSSLECAVRTWFYLGGITEPEAHSQRYKELNRARSDVYRHLVFHNHMVERVAAGVYPASTGIGMRGDGLSAGCLTLQTRRADVRLLALENPLQTPAYAYHPRYSPKSPKFSRAMALVMKDYVTTWVSGTASILDSESLHLNDPARQTEQTIENIECLFSAENFAFHGVEKAGATLRDFAKIRVYVKQPEHFEAVRSVCRQRLRSVPVVYVVADVCRPELLVEIEGVAFSRRL